MKRWIERRFTGWLGAMLVLIVMLAFAGAVYSQSLSRGMIATNMHWKAKWEYFSGTAAEAIKTGDTLAFHKYSGKVQKADKDDATRMPCIGMAWNNAAANGAVQIVTRGILSGVTAGDSHESTHCVTPYGIPIAVGPNAGGTTTYYGARTGSGVTQFVAVAMPMSEQAAASGVTASTDTYLVNVTGLGSSGVSPMARSTDSIEPSA